MSRAFAADTVTTWKPMPCASWLAVIALYAEEITHLSGGSEFGVCQVLSIERYDFISDIESSATSHLETVSSIRLNSSSLSVAASRR